MSWAEQGDGLRERLGDRGDGGPAEQPRSARVRCGTRDGKSHQGSVCRDRKAGNQEAPCSRKLGPESHEEEAPDGQGGRGRKAPGRAVTPGWEGEQAPAGRAWPGMLGHMLAQGAHGTFLQGAGARARCVCVPRVGGAGRYNGRHTAHLVTSEAWLPGLAPCHCHGNAGRGPQTAPNRVAP